MRLKTQLLFGLIVSIQLFKSSAQVFSGDGTGYVNFLLVPGFNMVGNPFNAGDNSIATLFSNFQGGMPESVTVYVYKNGVFKTAEYFAVVDAWFGDAVSETILPGDGVCVFLGTTTNKVLTFSGAIMQEICTELPKGFSIKSNLLPISTITIPSVDGDSLYIYIPATRNYDVRSYIGILGGWDSPLPVINVGEAFWYCRNAPTRNWCYPPSSPVDPPIHVFAIQPD